MNDWFSDLTDEAGAARDTFVPRPRAADTGRTPPSRADAVPDAVPVDVATGDVLLFQDDVSLPGLLPLVIGRAYRSSWRMGRWFGPSWASSLDQRLRVFPDRIVGVFADGRVLS